MTAAPHLWLIPPLPLAAVLLNLLLGDRLGRRGAGWLACGAVGLAFAWSLVSVLRLAGLDAEHRALTETVYTWMRVGDFRADVAFLLDPLSAVMILVVTGVGFLIHVYSIGYMAHDPAYARFFAYLNLFMFAMLMLVLGGQLPAHVRRLGGRRALLLPADRVLVRASRPRRRGQEGLHRQPHRRLRLPARPCC